MEERELIDKAISLVRKYIKEIAPDVKPTLFVVWQSVILQNFKCLIATTLPVRMHFELTFDGDERCWYLDAYRKVENRVIRDA